MCIPETVGSVETSGMGGEASTHTRKGWRVIPAPGGRYVKGRQDKARSALTKGQTILLTVLLYIQCKLNLE